jgi:hypothetical protein
MATRRTPEKCVLFTFFENLFLGALLAFLFYEKEKQKLEHATLDDSRRPGVKQQNVFSQPRLGDNNTDFHVG